MVELNVSPFTEEVVKQFTALGKLCGNSVMATAMSAYLSELEREAAKIDSKETEVRLAEAKVAWSILQIAAKQEPVSRPKFKLPKLPSIKISYGQEQGGQK